VTVIDSRADIVVDSPIDRATIRTVTDGVLATCTATHCNWQGLFPSAGLAKQAVESHYDHERRSGQYHYGNRTYTIVLLLDSETAQTVDESALGLDVASNRLRTIDGDVREYEFPRTNGDVSGIVGRGDVIARHHREDAVVESVTETRSLGLPTWTVRYLDSGVPFTEATTRDYYWINECIAQDGEVYQSFGEDPLATPAFEVVGTVDHQANLSAFGGVSG